MRIKYIIPILLIVLMLSAYADARKFYIPKPSIDDDSMKRVIVVYKNKIGNLDDFPIKYKHKIIPAVTAYMSKKDIDFFKSRPDVARKVVGEGIAEASKSGNLTRLEWVLDLPNHLIDETNSAISGVVTAYRISQQTKGQE